MILDNPGYERVDTDDLQVGDVVALPVTIKGQARWVDSEIASIQKDEGTDQMSIRVWRDKRSKSEWTQPYTVIRQNSWPFSAMIHVSNWLASDLEAVYDHQSLPHKMPRHFSSSFWSWSVRGKGVKFATYYDTCLYKGACRAASFSAR